MLWIFPKTIEIECKIAKSVEKKENENLLNPIDGKRSSSKEQAWSMGGPEKMVEKNYFNIVEKNDEGIVVK